MADNINDLVGQQALEQLAELKADLMAITEQIKNINATQINLSSSLAGKAGTANLQAVNDLLKQLQDNVNLLSANYEKYNIVAQQVINKNADIAASFNLMRGALSGVTTSFTQLTTTQNAYATSATKVNASTKNTGESMGMVERIVTRMLIRMVAMAAIFGTVKLALDALSKRVDDFNFKNKAVEEAAQGAGNKYSEEAVALKSLSDRMFDANATAKDRQEVLKELNKTIEGQHVALGNVLEGEKFLKENTPDFIEALELRAKAEGALNAISQEWQKSLEHQADPSQITGPIDKLIAGGKALTKALFSGGTGAPGDATLFDRIASGYADLTNEAGKADLGMDMTNTAAKVKFLTDSLIKLREESLKKADSAGVVIDPPDKQKAAKKQPDYIESRLKDEETLTKELAKQDAERFKTEAEYLRLSSEDETKSLGDRIISYRNYMALELAAKEAELDGEVKAEKEKLAVIADLQSQKDAGKKIAPADQRLIDSKAEVLGQIDLLNLKYGTLTIENERQTEDGVKKIYADTIQIRLEGLQEIADNEKIIADEKKQKTLQDYQQGLMDYQKFKDKMKKIDEQSAIDTRENQKQYLIEQINDAEISNAAKQRLTESLNKITGEGLDAQIKQEIATEEKIKRGREAVKAQAIQLANETISAIQTIQDNAFAEEQQQNQIRSQELQINYQQQIDAVNATIGAQSEKQQKLNELNAEETANQNQLAEQTKELAIRQATFDRAASEAKIIASTAEGVIKAFTQDIPVPAQIALAALVAATGAVEFAAAASVPIPQYYKGTKSAEGGLSIVGEQGSELVMHDGQMWVTPATPTFMDVPKGAEILTAKETMEIMRNTSLTGIINNKNNSNIDKYFREQTNELGRKIEQLTHVMAGKKPIVLKGFSKGQADYERISLGR